LIAILAIACLLFAFGVIAQNVTAGTSLAFDQKIVLTLRDPGNPSAPIGPAWVQEAARDLTSMGSIIVLVIMTCAVAIYLFLTRKYAVAWLLLVAVFGGMVMNDLLKLAFARPRPDHVYQATRVDAVIGPLVDVFLHEVGHAVFDYDQVPILGREEDAADQFAAYFWLQSDKRDARRLLAGVPYENTRDAAAPGKKNPFADAHGLPMQRFYNLLCLAYGSDAKLFERVVTDGHLPAERADGCEDEYAQVKKAMTALIDPFIDEGLAKRVRSKQWFNLDETIELK
jgi:Putative metallopeptidase